jgi:hypothetical protein
MDSLREKAIRKISLLFFYVNKQIVITCEASLNTYNDGLET